MDKIINNRKFQILYYILNIYETSVAALKFNYNTIKPLECERTKKSINSATAYLCRNLAQLTISLEYTLTTTSDNESFIVEDFISEIHYVAILLRSPVEGNIEELTRNIIIAVERISAKVRKNLLKIGSNIYEFTEFDYQVMEIIFEIMSTYMKVLIFTIGLLNYEDLVARYKFTIEKLFSLIKHNLLQNKDDIMKFELIRYIKCALQILNNHLEYIKKTIQRPNTVAKVKNFLDTVSEHIIFHILTFTHAIDADNPVFYMLNIMDSFENRYLAILQWVDDMVRSESTNDGADELLHQGVLVFAETIQNVSIIYEITNCFRLHRNYIPAS